MTYGNLIYNPNATFPSSGGVNLITEPNATMVTTGTVPYPRSIARDQVLELYQNTTNGEFTLYTVPSGQDLYVQKVYVTLLTSDSRNFVSVLGPGGVWLTAPQGFSMLDYVPAPMVVPSGTTFNVVVNNNNSTINYLLVALTGMLEPHDSGLWS